MSFTRARAPKPRVHVTERRTQFEIDRRDRSAHARESDHKTTRGDDDDDNDDARAQNVCGVLCASRTMITRNNHAHFKHPRKPTTPHQHAHQSERVERLECTEQQRRQTSCWGPASLPVLYGGWGLGLASRRFGASTSAYAAAAVSLLAELPMMFMRCSRARACVCCYSSIAIIELGGVARV